MRNAERPVHNEVGNGPRSEFCVLRSDFFTSFSSHQRPVVPIDQHGAAVFVEPDFLGGVARIGRTQLWIPNVEVLSMGAKGLAIAKHKSERREGSELSVCSDINE